MHVIKINLSFCLLHVVTAANIVIYVVPSSFAADLVTATEVAPQMNRDWDQDRDKERDGDKDRDKIRERDRDSERDRVRGWGWG